MTIDSPSNIPESRILKKQPKVALVLGGGAFHGAAHLGVIKGLEDAGVPIDLIVGTSAGSFVGSLYADCPHADSLKQLVETTKAKMYLTSHFSDQAKDLFPASDYKIFLANHLRVKKY